MKKNFNLLLTLLSLFGVICSCEPNKINPDDEMSDGKSNNFYKVTSKKIEKQWTLDNDWNYKYYDKSFYSDTLITSTSQLKASSNSFIKYVVNNQFRGELSSSNKDYIGYDPFEEYNDEYFKDHILIIGITNLIEGVSLYSNGVGSDYIDYYTTDSNDNKVYKYSFTPFYLDHIYESEPTSEIKHTTLFIYDKFKISESQFKGKTPSEVKSLFLGNTTDQLVYYYHTIYKDAYNKEHPDYKID